MLTPILIPKGEFLGPSSETPVWSAGAPTMCFEGSLPENSTISIYSKLILTFRKVHWSQGGAGKPLKGMCPVLGPRLGCEEALTKVRGAEGAWLPVGLPG